MQTAKVSIEEIRDDFEVYGLELTDCENIEKKCLEICQLYNLTGEQIAVGWLEFATSNNYEEVTIEGLERFEKEKLKKKSLVKGKAQEAKKELNTSSNHLISAADDDLLAAYGATPAPSKNEKIDDGSSRKQNVKPGLLPSKSLGGIQSSPLVPSLSQSPSTPKTQRYALRSNSGTIIASFGSQPDSSKWTPDLTVVPEVQEIGCGGADPLISPYNYMFEKLRDCADVLDDGIYILGDQLRELLGIEDAAPLCCSSNESVWCIGRICCDSVGRLNAASVLLEGDRENCSGSTVQLDLSRLKKYSIFPGQIMAVKGINTTGTRLVAEELIMGKILPMSSNPLTLEETGIYVKVACGPYTTLEDLSYDALEDLLQEVAADPPHVLILLGPLVDASHPCLLDPLLADTYDSILIRCLEKIDLVLNNCDAKVFVVSSCKDICCPPIYPTPPLFLSGSLTPGSKIKVLPDPSLINVCGVTIGITATDLIMQISREEISFPPQSGDRIARLAQHALLQQSFYPLYPEPEGFCLSLEQADLHCRLPFTPHIMIMPSDLKAFIKEVEGCLIINPEKLAKGNIGGSFAKLLIKPPTSEDKKKVDVNVQIIKI